MESRPHNTASGLEGSTMKKLAATVVGALVLAGCGSVRYPTSYLLNSFPAPGTSRPPQPVLGPVAVREFRCPNLFVKAASYRPGPGGSRVSTNIIAGQSVHARTRNTSRTPFGSRSLFKSVAVNQRGMDVAYVLTGNIERLEEADQGRDVRAVPTIFVCHQRRSGSIVWNHTASETVPVQQRIEAWSAVCRKPPGPPSMAWLKQLPKNSRRDSRQ